MLNFPFFHSWKKRVKLSKKLVQNVQKSCFILWESPFRERILLDENESNREKLSPVFGSVLPAQFSCSLRGAEKWEISRQTLPFDSRGKLVIIIWGGLSWEKIGEFITPGGEKGKQLFDKDLRRLLCQAKEISVWMRKRSSFADKFSSTSPRDSWEVVLYEQAKIDHCQQNRVVCRGLASSSRGCWPWTSIDNACTERRRGQEELSPGEEYSSTEKYSHRKRDKRGLFIERCWKCFGNTASSRTIPYFS